MVKFQISNFKFQIVLALLAGLLCPSGRLDAQQPQAQSGQPIYPVNAKYVNGVAPGYWPTAGSGLTLNLSAGTVICNSVATNYAGGTLSMTASQTNYVFLNPTTGCSPFATTSPFVTGQIPIAIVVAGSSTITSVTDVRTWFSTGATSFIDPQAVSVKACGAYGDGSHDDTAAIQACLNMFTNGLTGLASGSLYFPGGNYAISGPLYYVGSTSNTFKMVGLGPGYGASQITCTSAGCSPAMLVLMGMNMQSGVQGIFFEANGHADKGIWVSSTNGVGGTFTQTITAGTHTVTVSSTTYLKTGSFLNVDSGADTEFIVVSAVGSGTITATFAKGHVNGTAFGNSAPSGSGMTFKDVNVYDITGSPSYGITIGSPFTESNETATINFVNVHVSSGSPYTYGVASLDVSNTEGFYFYGGGINGADFGLAFEGNHQVTVFNTQFTTNGADLRLISNNAELINLHSEGSAMFIDNAGMGGSTGLGIVIENCSWDGTAAASGPKADLVVSTGANLLTIINSQFHNERTNSSLPLFQVGDALFSQGAFSVYSQGNWYANATGYAPFVDGNRNTILPTYYGNQPLPVTSLNDMGSTIDGHYTRLTDYSSTSILADASCGTGEWAQVATTGLIRTCNGGVPVSFRSYDGSSDIPGMTTNSSDQVVLGSVAGIKATKITTSVATGTAPIDVSGNTTPVAMNVSGNAGSASALAASPSQCTGSDFATGVAANGNANCATPPTGLTISTAGQGGFYAVTIFNSGGGQGLTHVLGSANEVRAMQFVLPFSAKITNITFDIDTPDTGGTADIGIYSAVGNLLLHTGGFSTTSADQYTVTITPVTLSADVYWLAWTGDNTTFQLRAFSTDYGISGQQWYNRTNRLMGVVVNSATAGVLPASLGGIASGTSMNAAAVWFDN